MARIGYWAGGAVALLVILGLVGYRGARLVASAERGAQALNEAELLMDANQYAAAIPRFTAALGERLSPADRAVALGNRGWSYTNVERDPDAIQDFNAALQIDPNLVFVILDRGLAFHRQGKFSEAMAAYDRTVALDPNNLDAFRNRALIHAHLGHLPEAIADMDEAIRCDPTGPDWYVRRAGFFAESGALDSALASYESALGLDPENPDAHWGRAKVFARKNQPEVGLAEVTAAILRRPDSARLHSARGLIQLPTAPREALQDFEAAIRLQPDFAVAYSNRGAAELVLGEFDAALESANRALSLDPQLSTPYTIRGRVYETKRKHAEALLAFDQAIARDSENKWALGWRALSEAHLGRYEEARRHLQDAVRRFPGAFELHVALAWFLASCPDPAYRNGEMALREARRAVKLSSGEVVALDSLAIASAEAGDYEAAIRWTTEALTKLPASSADRKDLERRLANYQQRKPFRDGP